MANNSSYTAGHFELCIDGAKTTSYLKSLEGGFMNHSQVSESVGVAAKRIMHAAVREIDPVSFEIGMSGAAGVLKWIQDSWRDTGFSARNGQINHANFNLETVFEHEFSDALITEVTFPALDGASKESAYLKVKFQPRTVATKKLNGGPKITPLLGPKQKSWLCSAFRFSIDGIDTAQYVNKIESFTIKQSCKKLFRGASRDFELCPTKIEFPTISCSISLQYADGILDWYDQYIRAGKRDIAAQKSGSLEFLSPDRASTLFRINFRELGLTKFQIQQSTANADQIKRVKFDLYVGDMDLDGPGALGME